MEFVHCQNPEDPYSYSQNSTSGTSNGPIRDVDSDNRAPYRFQIEYPEVVPSAQFTCVIPTNVLLPLRPWYFPVPPV